MDIIVKLADKFVLHHLTGIVTEYVKVIDVAREQLNEIDSHYDRIKFLNIAMEGNARTYDVHKLDCKKPDSCRINFAHESITYFLAQELGRLGVSLNEDTFTIEEKDEADSRLEKILMDLAELKRGHQIIYDDLREEINELKELYFLGKKKWQQILVGKCVEMVAGGVIGETVSKQIIDEVGSTVTRLIES